MGTSFIEETAVRPAGSGRYEAHLDPAWNLRPLPQGGVAVAVALRAIASELDQPTQRLRTLHATFAAQVASGPVEVDVEVLRRGRTMSQARAEIRNPGAPRGHLVSASHGAPRPGFAFTDLRPPVDVPHPDDCPSFRDPPPDGVEPFEPMPFWVERVEGRAALGTPPWDLETVRDRAERASWHRLEHPTFDDDGVADPLGLVVLADVMPGAVAEKLGPHDPPWFGPSIDLTVHLLDDCRSSWVLAHNTARWVGDGYASADMALWDLGPACDEAPRLVAYATQLFLFTFAS